MILNQSNTVRQSAFTLMELLVTASILLILGGVAIPAFSHTQKNRRQLECLSRLRAMGQAVLIHAQENGGRFPRSRHSAGSHRERNWATVLLPYLGANTGDGRTIPTDVFNRYYRCPEHRETDATAYSYALNVYFELDPETDGGGWAGSPATWRRVQQVPTPTRTILLAETREHADHMMCHFWAAQSDAEHTVAYDQHSGRSHFLFVDGHVELLKVGATYDPSAGVNLWNPSLAK